MPFIKSLASAHYTKLMAVILLFSKIMPSCSCYKEKKLGYIIITALFSRQPSSYVECTKLNMYLSCNVRSVSNTKYTFVFLCNIHNLS